MLVFIYICLRALEMRISYTNYKRKKNNFDNKITLDAVTLDAATLGCTLLRKNCFLFKLIWSRRLSLKDSHLTIVLITFC